jgi:hypothetical protein
MRLSEDTLSAPVYKTEQVSLVYPESREETVEQTLSKLSYHPVTKVITDSPQGLSGTYMKVIDPEGNYAYVELNHEGRMTSDGHSWVVENLDRTSEIPMSTKRGYVEMIEPGRDVVIECKDGICLITKNQDNSMKETMLTLTSHSPNTLIVENDEGVPYPVVAYNLIVSDPHGACQYISKLNKCLEQRKYHTFKELLKRRECALDNYLKTHKELNHVMEKSLRRLMLSIDISKNALKYYCTNPPCTECEKEKYNDCIHNLKLRYRLLDDLYKIGAKVSLIDMASLEDMTRRNLDRINFLNERYCERAIMNVRM